MNLNAGDLVLVDIMLPGPVPEERVAGSVLAFVLNASQYESDVVLVPSEENLSDARAFLEEADVALDDCREGPVYVLRNQNSEWMRSILPWRRR